MEQSATKNGKEKLKKIYKIDFNEHSRLRSSRRNEMKLLMSTIDKRTVNGAEDYDQQVEK
jgi:hypothetical protein